MGLAEKRAVEQFKTTTYPKLKTQIDSAAGYDVPVEVNWDTLGADGYTDNFTDEATVLYFKPLIGALSNIAQDDMGKEALKSGLKKIVVTDSKKFIDSSSYSFNDGILTIDHRLVNTQNPENREKKIVNILSEGL